MKLFCDVAAEKVSDDFIEERKKMYSHVKGSIKKPEQLVSVMTRPED